jgi:hypothetical protein
LVGHRDVAGACVGVGVNRNDGNPALAARPCDAYCDLTAIGYQNLVEHGS